ncbi:MAG: hypothetical protein JRE56_04685, partial [Deltaproteobacteria bacterium]|nr:hypothetical protein [Deltaproteobacteria bacterium]
MKKFLLLVMATVLAFPLSAFAVSSEEAMMAELQKQIAELSEELEELSDRLDGPERHSALDRIEFSGDLRSRVHSVHYDDVTFNPGINVDFTDFFTKVDDGDLGPFNNFNPQFSIIGMGPQGPIFDDDIPATDGI